MITKLQPQEPKKYDWICNHAIMRSRGFMGSGGRSKHQARILVSNDKNLPPSLDARSGDAALASALREQG